MVLITLDKGLGVESAGKYLRICVYLVGDAIGGEEERLKVAVLRNGYAQKLRLIVINSTSRIDIEVIRV